MFKKSVFLLLFCSFVSTFHFAVLPINKPAPYFSAISNLGEKVSLTDFKGKTVVLEWTNHGCPFVKKFYNEGHMQGFQKQHVDNGGVWLSIVSSAPGKQGQLSETDSQKLVKKQGSHASHVLLDPSGLIGSIYHAKTTPHMFVIDKKGILRYQGAIDSIRSANPQDIDKSTHYVSEALFALSKKKKVDVPQTKAYGCGVKY